jgi:uncharacterized Zn finger protein (UPF0148 family)
MSEPEIARRCHSCGVSVREQAAFCPQCGNELKRAPAREDSSSIHETEEIHDTEEIVIKDGLTLTEADFQARHDPPAPAPQKIAPKPKPSPRQQSAKPPATHGAVGARIQRATDRARDVQDNAKHRVQKFREISSVVLDEAGYDPSLRFVLVAGALFVLFLVIVLLNKLIG